MKTHLIFTELLLDRNCQILKRLAVDTTPKLQQFIYSYLHAVDQMVIGRIEQLEGRVPSDTELARYGHCIKRQGYPDQWTWRGKPIVAAEIDLEAVEYRIKPIFSPT